MAGLKNALRTDIPDDLSMCRLVLVRGTKNKHRFSEVPIVTDEQRLLLAYAKKYARGWTASCSATSTGCSRS